MTEDPALRSMLGASLADAVKPLLPPSPPLSPPSTADSAASPSLSPLPSRAWLGADADERLSLSSTSSVASVVAEAIAAAVQGDPEAMASLPPSPGAPGSLDFKTVTFSVPVPAGGASERRLSRANSRPLFSERKQFTPTADKLVVVMVGLPARGKSFIAKKLWKFFGWKGLNSKVFNVGQLRRAKAAGGVQDHSFFDPHNARAHEVREQLAVEALENLQRWFVHGDEDGTSSGDVAIYDATNSTKKRRLVLLESFDKFAALHKMSVHVVFVESICTSEAVILANMRQKVANSPDYAHMREDEAIADLQQRMKNYEAAYEALEDAEKVSYIKLFDLQSKVHAKGMYVPPSSQLPSNWLKLILTCLLFIAVCCSYGHVAKSILPYMMSFHIEHRPIWLVRAGHCTEVRRDFGAITKDPCIAPRAARLSQIGLDFAFRLGEFVKQRTATWMANEGYTVEDSPADCLAMTSTLPRAVETAMYLPTGHRRTFVCLLMLDTGGDGPD